MTTWFHGLLALILIAGLMLAGCLSPIYKVEKRCVTGRFGSVRCECRDQENGQFVTCPPEWKSR